MFNFVNRRSQVDDICGQGDFFSILAQVDQLVNLAAAFKIDSSDKFSVENAAPGYFDVGAVEKNPLPSPVCHTYIYSK